MRKGMFLRLALTNIKKNRGTYIPYMLSCMGCIAVLYIMMFIVTSPDTVNMRGGRDVAAIVSMGVFILGVFSVIFLLFCNSFLMKRRQKELGLYNVLGMGKKAHQSSDACGNSVHRYCEPGRRTGGRNPWK